MVKSIRLKDVLSQAGISFMTLRHITPEQVQRVVVPALNILKREIDAKKKVTKTS